MTGSPDLPTTSAPRAPSAGTLEVGSVVGDYTVRECVGRGSWATVYRATHSGLGVEVALKVVAPLHAGAADRLRREAQSVGRLHHPAIVALREVGETADGLPFLVTEWVGGGSLRRLIAERGSLAWPEAARIALVLAEALAYAHGQGIIHRDLKPENVLLERDGRPRLADFGVAGALTERRHDTAVTQAGVIVGTPRYMAPEQLAGESNSAATDLFGLGLLLLEMLFGAPPGGGGARELLVRRLTQDEQVPERGDVPAPLRALLRQMLRRSQAERPASAAAVAEALRTILVDARTAAPGGAAVPDAASRAPRAPTRTAAPAVRVPLALAAALAVGTLLLLLVAMLLAAPNAAAPGRVAPSPGRVAIELLQGVLLIVAGIAAGWAAARALARRRSVLDRDAGQLLLGTRDRRALTRTIALEVDELIARTQAIDARVLGMTIVQMVREYERAKESTDRQAALMNATQLLEKLMARLSPWYVRHDRAVAAAVSAVGVVSGLVKIASDLADLARGG
jgi:hypothetical protein